MFKITQASESDIPAIIAIAGETWWPAYSPILTRDQIQYMLDTIYSPEAVRQGIRGGSQTFLLLHNGTGPQGFASYGQRTKDPSTYKLHKLYVLPVNHGKGYGRSLLEEIKNRLLRIDVHVLELNVNRRNPARHFYEKVGFRIVREEDIPIGPYWMNDYVMRIEF